MSTQTTLQKRQRREDRRAGTASDRRQFRVIVLPVPGNANARELSDPTGSRQPDRLDDLHRATWEDAEWR